MLHKAPLVSDIHFMLKKIFPKIVLFCVVMRNPVYHYIVRF